jgi:hypothetical protein
MSQILKTASDCFIAYQSFSNADSKASKPLTCLSVTCLPFHQKLFPAFLPAFLPPNASALSGIGLLKNALPALSQPKELTRNYEN